MYIKPIPGRLNVIWKIPKKLRKGPFHTTKISVLGCLGQYNWRSIVNSPILTIQDSVLNYTSIVTTSYTHRSWHITHRINRFTTNGWLHKMLYSWFISWPLYPIRLLPSAISKTLYCHVLSKNQLLNLICISLQCPWAPQKKTLPMKMWFSNVKLSTPKGIWKCMLHLVERNMMNNKPWNTLGEQNKLTVPKNLNPLLRWYWGFQSHPQDISG